MALDDLLAGSQTDAVSGVLTSAVQTLAHAEQTAEVFVGDADAVVLHVKAPELRVALRAYTDLHRPLRAELDAVADQVFEQQHQLRFDPAHVQRFEVFRNDLRPALFQR